jgi:hypothetical protein
LGVLQCIAPSRQRRLYTYLGGIDRRPGGFALFRRQFAQTLQESRQRAFFA